MKIAMILVRCLAILLACSTLVTSCAGPGGSATGEAEIEVPLAKIKFKFDSENGTVDVSGQIKKGWCIEICFFDAAGKKLDCMTIADEDGDGKIEGVFGVPEGAKTFSTRGERNWDDDSGAGKAPVGKRGTSGLSSLEDFWFAGGPVPGGVSLQGEVYAFVARAATAEAASELVDAMLESGVQAPKPDGVDVYQWMRIEASELGLVYHLIEDAPLTQATLEWNGVEDYETLDTLASYMSINGYHVYSDAIPLADVDLPGNPFVQETVTNGFVACYKDALGQQSDPSLSLTFTEAR